MTAPDLPGRVAAWMAEKGMLDPAEETSVLCACSGGADSVALLHLLWGMEGVRLCCAHFNHCLRGPESDRDEEFVRRLCREWGIPFLAGRGDVAAYGAERGMGTEEAARELRYAFLKKAAETLHCSRIATAHNAEDNAETVLFHLLRGTGTRGLTGIPPVRGSLIRPLLTTERAEIEAYLRDRGLDHVEDSSNRSQDYARNRLRHGVLPVLRELNSGAVRNICSCAALLREDEDYLEGQAAAFFEEKCVQGVVPVPALLALPRPVVMRVLRRFCGGGSRPHLEAVYALCTGGSSLGAVSLPGAQTAVKSGDTLRLGPPSAARSIPERPLRVGETLLIPETGQLVSVSEAVFSDEIHNSFNTFYLKRENISDVLCVRSRRAGDSLRLAGRNCSKTLKKLFVEAGVPRAQRDRVLVLADSLGVVAVEGLALAERCAARPGDRTLRVEFSPPPEKE